MHTLRILTIAALFCALTFCTRITRADHRLDLRSIHRTSSGLRSILERFEADRESLDGSYGVDISPAHRGALRKFYQQWLDGLKPLDFDRMDQDGKIDYVLFKNYLQHALRGLEIDEKNLQEQLPFLPFFKEIVDLEEARRRMEWANPEKSAELLDR